MNRPPRRTLLSLFILLLVFVAAPTYTAWAAEDFSHGIVNRKAAIAAAEAVTAKKYPDADMVVVDSMERVRYQADGTYVQWDEEWVKILTEKGRQQNTTLSSYYTIPYERGPKDCRIPLVEIIKPDGKVVPIDVAKNSQVMISRSQMAENIYDPNEKVIRVNVPGLAIGDTLHYVMYDHFVRARIPGTFCDWLGFEGRQPIVRAVVEIRGPKSLPLAHVAVKDPAGKTLTSSKPVEKDGVITYRWEARNVPQMYPEPNMPEADTVAQRVLVSTTSDWQTISRWYWNLSKPHYVPTPAMKAEVAQLIRGAKDDSQKIRAIFDWVSHEVRYLGVTAQGEAPGYEPQDVSTTFTRRRGVCRDKAALLVAMLRAAGFKAFPVLIDTGPKKDAEVPQPYFDHAITAVRKKDGGYILMDSTNESTRRLLPSYLSHKSYLVATPKGDPLRVSPIVPADENMVRIETTGHLNALGNLHGSTKIVFSGINDNIYRGFFANVSPGICRRYFETVLQRAAAGAKLTDIQILPRNMEDTSIPLSVRFDFEVPDALIRGGGTLMVPLPMLGHRIGDVNFVVRGAGLKKRKYPFVTGVASGVLERVAIDVPASLGEVASLPASDEVVNDALLWRASWRQTDHTLVAEQEFQVKKVRLSPKEYGKLKDTLRVRDLDLRKMPIFRASGQAAQEPRRPIQHDVDVTNLNVDYRIQDAHDWSETRSVEFKVLTYAGKKRFAELKIPFDPAWSSVKLEEGVVTSRSGEVHHVDPQEVTVMDASGGSAPRYPVEKVLIVNFPSVEVGSTVHYRFTRTFKDRPFVAIRESFGGFDPIRRKTVRLTAPAGMAVATREINDFRNGASVLDARSIAQKGKTVGWEWTAHNLPAIRREGDLPPLWSFTPTVLISTGHWKSYAARVGSILQKNAEGQAQTARKATKLTAGLSDDASRVGAIRDFVASTIRLVGPGLAGMPLSYVSNADRTLLDEYGNRTDRAVLLFSMLSAVGFHPQFVLPVRHSRISQLGRTALSNPDYASSETVLVRVRVGGKDVYLNDSDQYAHLGASAYDGCLGIALPSGRAVKLTVPADCADHTEFAYAISVQPNGDGVVQKTLRVFGTEFARLNREFSQMRPEARRRYYQEAVAALSQNAEPIGKLKTDFSSYPGVVSFSARVAHLAIRDHRYLYLQVPRSLRSLFDLRSDSRDNPRYYDAPTRERITVEVTCPPGFQVVRAPNAFSRDVLGGEVSISATRSPAGARSKAGDKISLVYSADVPAALVDPKDYGDLFDLDSRLSQLGTRTILLLAPAGSPAPAHPSRPGSGRAGSHPSSRRAGAVR